VTKREGRIRYEALRSDITRLINDADLLGLLRLGAPLDEYSSEISTILPRLKEASSETTLRRIIHEEFCRWFGSEQAGVEAKYAPLAAKIWDCLSTVRTV